MSRFTSITYDVDAVQWKGEVTPEIEKLFDGHEVAVKTSGSPFLVVPVITGTQLAEVGEWVVRYPEDSEGDRDFDVLDDEDFRSVYEAKRSPVDMDIGIPISVVGPGGEGVGEVRVKVKSMKADPNLLLEAARQIFGGIDDPAALASIAGHLISRCDRQGLTILKDLISQLERLDGNPG